MGQRHRHTIFTRSPHTLIDPRSRASRTDADPGRAPGLSLARESAYGSVVPSSARSAAREAEANPAFRVIARAGYAANGILHLLIGGLVIAVGFGAREDSDQTGAFRALAAVPLGAAALWALAIGLVTLGAWHLLQAFAPRRFTVWRRIGRIATEAPQGLIFVAVGLVSASVALGARPHAEQAAESLSEAVLTWPVGGFVLGAVGLAVAGVGIGFVWMGLRRSFHSKVRTPDGPAGFALSALGVIGFAAKGVALIVVGVLVVVAAITVEPDTAGGLDGATSAVIALPAGPVLASLVGLGFLAYGAFTVFRARYARLDA